MTQMKLTPAQTATLHRLLCGPLFRTKRHWRRGGGPKIDDRTIGILRALGFVEDDRTRQAVAFVRITDSGRERIGARPRGTAAAVSDLHERIAP